MRRLRTKGLFAAVALVCLFGSGPAEAQPVPLGPWSIPGGPFIPISGACSALTDFYSNTQITDNGDGILTSALEYPGFFYGGYADNYESTPYTLILYDREYLPEPIGPQGLGCWKASYTFLQGDPAPRIINFAFSGVCYSSPTCEIFLNPAPRWMMPGW